MPRGRPKKNPAPLSDVELKAGAEDSAVAVENVETQKVDPVEAFRKALNELISADPQVAAKVMADVLGVSEAKPRTVEPERQRKVEVPKQEILPPAPAPPRPGVVFFSQAKSARFAFGSGTRYDALGNKEILPPVVVDFHEGMHRATNPATIERMRGQIAKAQSRGERPLFIELRDELALEVEAGRRVANVASNKVTADTPLADLVTA